MNQLSIADIILDRMRRFKLEHAPKPETFDVIYVTPEGLAYIKSRTVPAKSMTSFTAIDGITVIEFPTEYECKVEARIASTNGKRVAVLTGDYLQVFDQQRGS